MGHTWVVREDVPGVGQYRVAGHERHDVTEPSLSVPGGHWPLHEGVASALELPYTPAGQLVQDVAPPVLYVGGRHMTAVPLVDPAGQVYPAVHGPPQAAEVEPVVEE
jgi:hypothetical protein